MTTIEGSVEEHSLNFERQGDEIKPSEELHAAAERVGVAAFRAHGMAEEAGKVLNTIKGMLSSVLSDRGPSDFPKRRRPRYVRITNNDEGFENRLLPWILGLLLVILFGVGLVLYQLKSIEKGQDGHEQRINRIEQRLDRNAQPNPP